MYNNIWPELNKTIPIKELQTNFIVSSFKSALALLESSSPTGLEPLVSKSVYKSSWNKIYDVISIKGYYSTNVINNAKSQLNNYYYKIKIKKLNNQIIQINFFVERKK